MKILELRFKNLNSLYGEWLIDFTDPNYTSTGIFALTGPTGAGKSTILDAICLALYGKTPRLKRINQTENEIMSRQTGECYAEVLFESQEGLYRCHWEQRKARKKASGNLQDYIHQISDGKTGKLIETKKYLILSIIEEKTGMDFERFTRSVLLAQGGFDSFLKAGENEKSKILEQLTGSKIYTEISKSVYERSKKEKDDLTLLQAGIAGINILNAEEEKEIESNLSEKQKQEQTLNKENSGINIALTWLIKIADLNKEITALGTEEEKLQADLLAFQTQRAKLDLARKASSLEVIHAKLSSLRKQQKDEISSQTDIEKNLPKLKISASQQAEELTKAEKFTKTAKQNKEESSELIKQVRSLDQTISEHAKKIIDKKESCKDSAENIKAKKILLVIEQEKNIKKTNILELINKYLITHKTDEWLMSNLADIETQIGNLNSQKQEMEELNLKIDSINSELAKIHKSNNKLLQQEKEQKEKIGKVVKSIKEEKELLQNLLGDSSLKEYRIEEKSLLREMFLLKKIKSFEDERKSLIDGEVCPLCGSLEHPYAKGNTPEIDETQKRIDFLAKLIGKAEKKEELLNKYEKDESSLRSKLHELEKAKNIADSEHKILESSLKDLRFSSDKLVSKQTELQTSIIQKLHPLGINANLIANSAELIKELKSRLNTWKSKQTQKSDLDKEISAIQSEIKSLDAVIASYIKEFEAKQEDLEKLRTQDRAFSEKRSKLYGTKNPDVEEKLQQKAINDAEKSEKKTRDKNIELQQALVTASEKLESLKLTIQERDTELQEREQVFLTEINAKSFVDEKEFLQALLPHEEIDKLALKAKKLDDLKTEIKARQDDRINSLAVEKAKDITDKAQEDLETQIKKTTKTLEELRNTVAELKLKLNENTKAKALIKEKQESIKAQKTECFRWEKLSQLIGSADGKKYRNFAQGLTFELMIKQANSQLEKMSERYLLIRDSNNPLELNVIDNFQAGEKRSTKNLSGGESFIVSLALALGLSKMASKKVRVDSLFLDEGFGTLDEDALEIALNSLSGLHQEGKLIGIISHVSALKDRIATQISITPTSGGRSEIEGPGIIKSTINN